jgi:hypothetical protein
MTASAASKSLPGLFALADAMPVSGRDFLAAYVAGFETETRIARAVNFHHYDKGWHPTATLRHIRRHRSGLAAPRADAGSDRNRARHRGFVFVRPQGQLRHHDQAAACGSLRPQRRDGRDARARGYARMGPSVETILRSTRSATYTLAQ